MIGRSVEIVREVGAVGGVVGKELGADIKRSPVGSCFFAGLDLEDSKGGRWRSSTRDEPVKGEIGRLGGDPGGQDRYRVSEDGERPRSSMGGVGCLS